MSNGNIRIIKLLEKIGNIWPPPFSEAQLKTISKFWEHKLYKYSDKIYELALDELIEHFSRKPTLAEFLTVCKKHHNRQLPTVVDIYAADFIDEEQYILSIKQQFGATAAHHAELAYQQYWEAKRNNKMAEYIENCLRQMKLTTLKVKL